MLPEVNLLPKYERSESIFYNIFIIGIIIFILLAGLLGFYYFNTNSKLADAEDSVASLTEEKQVLEAQISAQTTENETLLQDVVAYVETYQTPTSILVDEYIQLLPDNSYLSSYNYNYNSVSIETQFETLQDTSNYTAELTEIDYLEEVVINRVDTFTIENQTDDEETIENQYDSIPRYDVNYNMDVNHQILLGGEEGE